jgi:hypothetical protein
MGTYSYFLSSFEQKNWSAGDSKVSKEYQKCSCLNQGWEGYRSHIQVQEVVIADLDTQLVFN